MASKGATYERIPPRSHDDDDDDDDDDDRLQLDLGVVPDPDNDVPSVHTSTATPCRGEALKKLYREWRDSDPDAIDSSAFSESGFICSPRAQAWLGIVGAIVVVVFTVMFFNQSSLHHRFSYLAFNAMPVAYTGVYLVAVCGLVYKNRQPAARALSKHGLLPAVFMQLIQTVCDAGGTYGKFWDAEQINSTSLGGRAFCAQVSAANWQGTCWWAFPSGKAYCSDPLARRVAGGTPQYYPWAEVGQNVTAWMKIGFMPASHPAAGRRLLAEWNVAVSGALLFFWLVLNCVVLVPGRNQLVLMTAGAGTGLFVWLICLHLQSHYSGSGVGAWYSIGSYLTFLYPILLCAVAGTLCWNRHKARAKATQLLQDDLKDYDRVWSECKQGTFQHTTVASPAARSLLNGGSHHCIQLCSGALWHFHGDDTGVVHQKLADFCTRWKAILPPSPQPQPLQPVNSISALFAQADAVNDWYQDKVED